MLENEMLGYKLAEEIRKLREDLLQEKQSKRMLLVTNENLQEQLHQAEQQIHQLQQSNNVFQQSLERFERISSDEVSHNSN